MRHSIMPVIVFVSSMAMISPATAAPGAQAPMPDAEAETSARAFVGHLSRQAFDRAMAQMTSRMRDAMPVERLRGTWATLVTQLGPFRQQAGVSLTHSGVMNVVLVTCEFERGTLTLRVAINPAGGVGGFGIVSPGAATAAHEPPSYANPAAYTERDVTVGSGDWALPGTLTMPADAAGPVPAVVLVHGSGPGDRDATIGPNTPFKDLALGLVSRGIAVLRYAAGTGPILPAEYAVAGHVSEDVIRDIAAWLAALPPARRP